MTPEIAKKIKIDSTDIWNKITNDKAYNYKNVNNKKLRQVLGTGERIYEVADKMSVAKHKLGDLTKVTEVKVNKLNKFGAGLSVIAIGKCMVLNKTILQRLQ